jgi:hypothetical protein
MRSGRSLGVVLKRDEPPGMSGVTEVVLDVSPES